MCIIVIMIFRMDRYDRTHPYGLDKERNKKLPNKVGENYGVTVFWGKPSESDDLKKHLDKIEWLSTSHERDVEWRRSMILAFIMSILLLVIIHPDSLFDLKSFMITFIILFMFMYFKTQYSKHHLNHRRSLFIKDHVSSLKKKIDVVSYNPIYKHFL